MISVRYWVIKVIFNRHAIKRPSLYDAIFCVHDLDDVLGCRDIVASMHVLLKSKLVLYVVNN